MAKKKKLELKNESVKALREKVVVLDQEIFAMRNELSWNRKLEKPHQLRVKRKEKARILTFLGDVAKREMKA
jgi:ribosomal protein L29